MKRVTYHSLADIAQEKESIRAAIEQQRATLVDHYKSQFTTFSTLDYVLPLVEGVWFGVKMRRFARNLSGSVKWFFSLFSPKRHL